MKQPAPNLTPLASAVDGLFIVQTPRSLEPLVILIVLDQIARARADLGFQMPKVDAVKVFCGGGHAARSHFRRMVTQSICHADLLEFVQLRDGIDSRPIALELLPAWLPSLDEAKAARWWVVRHTLDGRPTVNLYKALERMRGTWRKAKTRGLVILSTEDTAECASLEPMADEYLIAEECEDGLRGPCLSFESPAASAFTPFISAKVMCSVRQTASGLRFSFQPFISPELDVRVMARLRGTGRTYEAVGKIVNMDKSTVLRRLRGVRIPSGPENPAWLDAVKDHYGS